MSGGKLKEDLSNCLINFDRRVVITELLEDYQLSYNEVNRIVHDYLIEQEEKLKQKFEKKYLVHGLLENESKKEVYKIVEEASLNEWLEKLQNSESTLYSVEVAGGAKSAAPVFKPMKVVECEQSNTRATTKALDVNGVSETSTAAVEKNPVKAEKQKVIKQQPKTTPKKQASPVKKISPKSEIAPTGQKAEDKKPTLKKGINNFFAPSTSTTKKPEEAKPKTGVAKPTTPKKMVDFFKKQSEKPPINTESSKKPTNNTSIQLFDDNEEEPEDGASSDEEEKLEALKRDIISSDVEMQDAEDESTQTVKRRRILDSDDEEEDHPVKQEKLELKEEVKEEEAVAETYLDEEGFVITKKPKQKSTSHANKSPATKKTPPVTIKTSPNQAKKSASSKETKTTAKTKQAGIMNFFSKK